MSEEDTRKISILPETVSSRIAAGEVVERPAAVVKELLDNSLDAGSKQVTVEVGEGGSRLIRVTDDGEGMTRSDAQLACQRFATSKLRSEHDLLNIMTLGFRGEALPSIASISKFCLRTIPRDGLVGTELRSEGGETWSVSDYAGAQGTQVEVRNLFFNTPARKKFLKSITTEFSKISQAVQQAAMAWPSIHFRLIHNDHPVSDYPSATSREDRILQIYGTRFINRVLPVNHERPGLRIEGYTANPYYTRASRSPQEIFVNRRSVKNSTIAHAAYEAYGTFLPKGRHPIFALFIEIDPATVDVNVHPAKREVRFAHPEFIHASIKEALRSPLHSTPGEPSPDPPPRIPQLTKQTDRWGSFPPGTRPPSSTPGPQNETAAFDAPSNSLFSGNEGREGISKELSAHESAPAYSLLDQELNVVSLGQVSKTFLIGQINAELHIVDQHTAHERVQFERLLRAWHNQSLQTQTLLIPEPIDLPPHQCELLAEHLPSLAKMGLEIEQFGPHAFVVRAVPAMLGPMSVSSLIPQLIEDLSEWNSLDSLEKKIQPIFASMACQSAVQAGRSMTDPEITELLSDWAREGYPMTCPHGRRIALRLPFDELDKMFGRTKTSGC